jgi:transposase-like protein
MSRYSPEFKEQVVRKMMPPHSQSVAKLSRDTGIAQPTLYAWRNKYRAQGEVVPAKSSKPDEWGWKAKAAALLKTETMNEAEKAEFCRQNGLYVEQLEGWQEAFEVADGWNEPVTKAEINSEKQKVKKLEKELRRKDKALAEAAALLILAKKAQAIWGIQEED